MSYTKDKLKILTKKIRVLSPEQFIEEYKDTEINSSFEANNLDTGTRIERQEILIASSTDIQLLALARQRFLDWDFIPDEQEAANAIESLWNRRWGSAEHLEIPISTSEISKAELKMLAKKMIELLQTREELKENPEGIKNSFTEGNIYRA